MDVFFFSMVAANLLWAVVELLLIRWFYQAPSGGRLLQVVLRATLAVVAVCGALKLLSVWNIFGVIRALCFVLFLHLPLCLVGVARWRPALGVLALGLVAVGLDALWFEPKALVISRLTIPTTKLTEPLRIVLIADLQTAQPGAYEARALQAAADEAPDLILFAGDYLQVDDQAAWDAGAAVLRPWLQALRPTYGGVAVEGDFEPAGWTSLFAESAIDAAPVTTTVGKGPVVVTALTRNASWSPATRVASQDRFHIVLGHRPDFALGQPQADLLLAGHVHGGQIQLPGIGPLWTLTAVPRAWAAGHTPLPWGGDLVVSRGVGVERGQAPPIRFLCRPELVVIELVPG